jgi:thymidylate synthase (FAD)
MESQRYINYFKERHGEDITFIKPVWISWGDLGEDDNCKELILKDAIDVYSVNKQAGTYLDSLIQSEEAYKELINLGWSPQQAREVLPLATKSEVVYTAFASDWKHWFGLRLFGTTGKPHPNMEEIARLAQQELIKNNLWNLIYPENERN